MRHESGAVQLGARKRITYRNCSRHMPNNDDTPSRAVNGCAIDDQRGTSMESTMRFEIRAPSPAAISRQSIMLAIGISDARWQLNKSTSSFCTILVNSSGSGKSRNCWRRCTASQCADDLRCRERNGWLILELMAGNLDRLMRAAPLAPDIVRTVLICCLSGLRSIHSNGVLHGDVKPSNLLYTTRGLIKLGDFGLARRANDDQGSLLKGATKYMAPELADERFGPVGPASDLYSLGFSAYELVCGPLFEPLFPAPDLRPRSAGGVVDVAHGSRPASP